MSESIRVLFEDNHLLAVEKPPGVLTQGDRTGDESLFEQAKFYLKEKDSKPGAVYLGLVHRLDRPTGGVILFCRTSKAAGRVSEQIRSRRVEKVYLALCHGTPKEIKCSLEDCLAYDEKRRKTFVSKRGQIARLSYTLVGKVNHRSLLKVSLETGRKHQIRAQLAHHGHPIVGDVKYGKEQSDGGVVRAFGLWAHQLTLQHPVKKEPLTLTSVPDAKAHVMWQPFQELMSSFSLQGRLTNMRTPSSGGVTDV